MHQMPWDHDTKIVYERNSLRFRVFLPAAGGFVFARHVAELMVLKERPVT